LLTNRQRLIKAAYAYSDELGQEVEALANDSADPERLKRLRKLVNREFGKQAGLVYETIVSVLCSSP
jgi:hypothetical protein